MLGTPSIHRLRDANDFTQQTLRRCRLFVIDSDWEQISKHKNKLLSLNNT